MSNTPLALRRVNIYEVVNHARRESLIALSSDDMRTLRLRLRASPPPEIAHWDRLDDLEYELLAVRMSATYAEHFVKLFLNNSSMRDWRLIPWRG